MKNKICTRCGIEKPETDFFKSGFQKSGKPKHRPDCKVCASKDTSDWRKENRAHYNTYMGDYRSKNPDKIRLVDIKRKYGLEPEQYLAMVKAQNNKCKICGKSPKGVRPLCIDHCHKTGKIRGLLCHRCNRAISILDDDDHLQKAIAYLKSDY